MRPLHFTIKLWRASRDVGVSNALVFNLPMEFSLELMAIVSANISNAERELFDDMINEVDGICLRVLVVDLKRPETCDIVNCVVLEPTHLFAAFSP